MCGFVGAVAPGGDFEVRSLDRATTLLQHRGPDDRGHGWWTAGGEIFRARSAPDDVLGRVALGHTRLSIVDLSAGGWQPMESADGRACLVFNGEIYNHRALRAELEARGHVFRSRSDSEVLLAAYREWGRAGLHRLVGMFAFAVLDTRSERVFLARDPFGIKPLYYARRGEDLVFASEIKALLALPGLAPRVNPARLHDYLVLGRTDHGDETLFAGVRQLPPGHTLEVAVASPHAAEPQPYWDLRAAVASIEPRAPDSLEAAARELRRLFLESVELHLESDVPVGACLSGGIDSSAIVMAIRHLRPRTELHTFSYISEDEDVNEERWIDAVADAAGSVSHKVHAGREELTERLPRLVDLQEEPFGSTSIYAQHRVFELVHEAGIKVVLDGQGADELLAGYRPYLGTRLASLLRRGELSSAWRLWQGALDLPGSSRRELLRSAVAHLVPEELRRALRRRRSELGLRGDWFRARGVGASGVEGGGRASLTADLVASVSRTSLPMLLRYEDRNSMHYSVESRVPFLTPRIAEFVLSLPERYLLGPEGTSKRVFREAMRGLVPPEILARRDKIGFATSSRWLPRLRPWVEETFREERLARIPCLDGPAVRSHWSDVQRGAAPMDWRVWRWVNVVQWAEHFGVDMGEGSCASST